MTEAFLEDTTEIRWSLLTPEGVEPAMREALGRARERIEAIGALGDEDLTLENTFLALEAAQEIVNIPWGRISHLDSVCNSPALRGPYNAMLPEVSSFFAGIYLDQGLWKKLKRFAGSPAVRSLSGVEQRFVEETVKDFEESGADLPEKERDLLHRIERELAEKTQKFSENVLDATNEWEWIVDDPAEIAGLPATAREEARVSALGKGLGSEEKPQWRFTLHAPSYLPVMMFVDKSENRRRVWEAVSGIGRKDPHDNTDLIRKILRLRQRKSSILGREHFADLVLERRMAKTGAGALEFVEDLHDRVREQFLGEIDALEAFRAERLGETPGRLEPWDIAYWSEKLRQAKYAFDEEEVRPYFPMDRVLAGMFDLAETLFGVSICERPSAFVEEGSTVAPGAVEVWHPQVKAYEVREKGGAVLGVFYADWYPRESKRSGAWMNSFRTGGPGRPGGEREPHAGLICGNFTSPVNGKPALLTHREVETVFHEFGHLLHHLLGDVPIKSLNGTHVVWDFVELPSQLMENFCWERKSLDLFARHWETGEPIPEELFERMLRSRTFQGATFTMRQLSFAKMDLELHLLDSLPEGDLDALIDRWLESYSIPTRTPRPNASHAFLHLFSSPTGYAAGYYSYKWAEVLDADAFTRFREDGVLSPGVGAELRDKILSRGNAAEAAELFRDFMGRDPQLDALLERAGIRATG